MTTLVSPRNSPLEIHLDKTSIDVNVVRIPHKGKYKDPDVLKKKMTGYIRKIIDLDPDIFLFMKDGHITPAMLRMLKKNTKRTKFVMWYGDQRGYVIPPLLNKREGLLDALLITNEDQRQHKMYRNKVCPNVFTFYHSFSTEEFKLTPTKLEHDVFFGGSNFKSTKFPLSAFRKKFICRVNKEFDLVVHGGGWPFKTEKWLLRPQYAKALRTTKLNLGINHYDMKRYYNRRLFECVASGRLHITYYIPGMEKHFKNNEHLIWFKSIPEGINKIKYYLHNFEEREKIAAQGRKFFVKHHSWPVRVKQLENILNKLG